MLDPVSAFAMASAAFNGIKRAVEIGREVQDVYSQLSQWAGAASDLQEAISQQESRKPGLFEKIGFGKNETSEAFDTMIAKQKLIEMEKEIRHEFLYGAFANLEGGYGSMDGYRKFCEMRRKIRADRIRMKQEQENMQAEFWAKVQLFGGGTAIVVVGLLMLYMAVDFIFKYGK